MDELQAAVATGTTPKGIDSVLLGHEYVLAKNPHMVRMETLERKMAQASLRDRCPWSRHGRR